MPGEPPTSDWSEYEELIHSRNTPFDIFGVSFAFTDQNSIRLTLKPQGLLSPGGCGLILIATGAFFLGHRFISDAASGTFTQDILYGLIMLSLIFIGLGLYAYTSATKKVVFEIREGLLTCTQKSIWRKKHEQWNANDIKLLGVHKGSDRDDTTRLEATLNNGEKEVIVQRWPYLSLCIVAATCRVHLDVLQEELLSETRPDLDQDDEHNPPPLIDSTLDVPPSTQRKIIVTETILHPMRQPSPRRAFVGSIIWLICVAIFFALCYWAYSNFSGDKEVASFFSLIFILAFWLIVFLAGAASLFIPIGVIDELVADEWIEVSDGHLRYRRRRLFAVNRTWPLREIETLALYHIDGAKKIKLDVKMESGISRTVYEGLELDQARSIAESVAHCVDPPIRIAEFDEEASYDG